MSIDPCPEAKHWLKGRSIKKAWNTCIRHDWMDFIIERLYYNNCISNEVYRATQVHWRAFNGEHDCFIYDPGEFYRNRSSSRYADGYREVLPYPQLMQALHQYRKKNSYD